MFVFRALLREAHAFLDTLEGRDATPDELLELLSLLNVMDSRIELASLPWRPSSERLARRAIVRESP
jgi:hypothetical protein